MPIVTGVGSEYISKDIPNKPVQGRVGWDRGTGVTILLCKKERMSQIPRRILMAAASNGATITSKRTIASTKILTAMRMSPSSRGEISEWFKKGSQ